MFDKAKSREIDSLYIVRAYAISAVVANHAMTTSLAGGLNLLLLLSGISFAQLCFSGRSSTSIMDAVLRFIRPLLLWSVVLCAIWFAVFERVELPEILMYSNWITENRVSKFPIWYTQVLLQIMLCLVVLFSGFRLIDRFQAAPVFCSAVALILTVVLATMAQIFFDTDALKDKLPHLHAWNFILGWLFWAVLINRTPTRGDRVWLTALTVPLLLFMFLALDVPAADARVYVAVLPIVFLIWQPQVHLPFVIFHPILLISQATLFLFFLHYPFLLAVRNTLENRVSSDLLGVLKFAVAMIGPILIWAIVTAAQHTLREARARRETSDGPLVTQRP